MTTPPVRGRDGRFTHRDPHQRFIAGVQRLQSTEAHSEPQRAPEQPRGSGMDWISRQERVGYRDYL